MVVDFRRLNKCFEEDHTSIPHTEDLINSCVNKQIFSAIDLSAAYHSVEVHEDSLQYMGVITSSGQTYLLNRMTFGWTNAPAFFQTAIVVDFRESRDPNPSGELK
eukprot:Nk52_evm1s1513 gene=Nk52_evmTU1s1513